VLRTSYEGLTRHGNLLVMAGLVPAIHVLDAEKKDVDARDKRGHDDGDSEPYSSARLAALENFLFTRSRFSLER
jgi:hypothetical protein